MEKSNSIKVIIADDNKALCSLYQRYLEKFDEIEILAIANNDEEEIAAIDNLKPDIVITDLVRNKKYSGLEIIKDYLKKGSGPEFLVISADNKDDILLRDVNFAGYIQKPFTDYYIIVDELRKISKSLKNNKNYEIIKKNNDKKANTTFSKKVKGLIKMKRGGG